MEETTVSFNNKEMYPACSTCHYCQIRELFLEFGTLQVCSHPDAKGYDVVTGEVVYPHCRDLRKRGGGFGIKCLKYVKGTPEIKSNLFEPLLKLFGF
jgi:hypothetical protein